MMSDGSTTIRPGLPSVYNSTEIEAGIAKSQLVFNKEIGIRAPCGIVAATPPPPRHLDGISYLERIWADDLPNNFRCSPTWAKSPGKRYKPQIEFENRESRALWDQQI
jgi:hypothetical protein